uniref:Uncharacterized protein n=1 Tax=Plectus sambesii TaxID=2011161 RepID=A0A914V846_9BILA
MGTPEYWPAASRRRLRGRLPPHGPVVSAVGKPAPPDLGAARCVRAIRRRWPGVARTAAPNTLNYSSAYKLLGRVAPACSEQVHTPLISPPQPLLAAAAPSRLVPRIARLPTTSALTIS